MLLALFLHSRLKCRNRMVYCTELELEQEPYDPEEFVERLAWRTASGQAGGVAGSPRVPRGRKFLAIFIFGFN